MRILDKWQYNQGISKYKLLSSTAGVGSIITTKLGYYILISDVNKWDFVHNAQRIIEEIREEETDSNRIYKRLKKRLPNEGIRLIDDPRFVGFLRSELKLDKLNCLISIPSIALDDNTYGPLWDKHPIKRRLPNSEAKQFMVKGTHFPKWFYNDSGDLREYSDWKKLWNDRRHGSNKFVPPRDADAPVKDHSTGQQRVIKIRSKAHGDRTIKIFKELTQLNLVLICHNGHLSDIPWSSYIKWKSSIKKGKKKDEDGQYLLDPIKCEPCCNNPKLKWTESKTKSEGYGSIYIECTHCKCGQEEDGKINLEGINNIKPICPGHKPWEINLMQESNIKIPFESCSRENSPNDEREKMQVALVTGNNVYFAHGFSSLYVPISLAQNKSEQIVDSLSIINEKYLRYTQRIPGINKEEFWSSKLDKEDFIIDNAIELADEDRFFRELHDEFIGQSSTDDNDDKYEVYRWEEYQCFVNNDSIVKDDLKLSSVELSEPLSQYFTCVKKLKELKITQVQLGFTRVRPRERIRVGNTIRYSTSGKNIFSISDDEVLTIPSNETYGEGLFFQFDEELIKGWLGEIKQNKISMYNRFTVQPDLFLQGATFKQKIYNNGIKHFLIHSFAHMIMRELEFSCGYPTASLKERLYISERMNGALIYTAEGSEGSMGGLTWQGEPINLEKLILNGLNRTSDCSSDPLCWQSDGQGIFDLNLAACFSCSLVSETSCEEMNLGLDRRSLVDEEFGYFKALIK